MVANPSRLKLANIIKKPNPILPPPDFPLLGGVLGVALEAALLATDAAELLTELEAALETIELATLELAELTAVELEELATLELDELTELAELATLELEELLVVGIAGQLRTASFTNAPEAVSCELTHSPFTLAPGTNADAPSFLSFSAQLAWLILFVLRKLSHAVVSLVATAPPPSAFTAPHSVTNSAIPLLSAVCALSRSDCLWVPA